MFFRFSLRVFLLKDTKPGVRKINRHDGQCVSDKLIGTLASRQSI